MLINVHSAANDILITLFHRRNKVGREANVLLASFYWRLGLLIKDYSSLLKQEVDPESIATNFFPKTCDFLNEYTIESIIKVHTNLQGFENIERAFYLLPWTQIDKVARITDATDRKLKLEALINSAFYRIIEEKRGSQLESNQQNIDLVPPSYTGLWVLPFDNEQYPITNKFLAFIAGISDFCKTVSFPTDALEKMSRASDFGYFVKREAFVFFNEMTVLFNYEFNQAQLEISTILIRYFPDMQLNARYSETFKEILTLHNYQISQELALIASRFLLDIKEPGVIFFLTKVLSLNHIKAGQIQGLKSESNWLSFAHEVLKQGVELVTPKETGNKDIQSQKVLYNKSKKPNVTIEEIQFSLNPPLANYLYLDALNNHYITEFITWNISRHDLFKNT